MKFLHLSDLPLGKRLMEVSFLDDQAQILHQTDLTRTDAILIAGDIYDKSVTLITAEEKGSVRIEALPLILKRDLRCLS